MIWYNAIIVFNTRFYIVFEKKKTPVIDLCNYIYSCGQNYWHP